MTEGIETRMPDISVIILTLNAEKHIEKQIAALKKQSYPVKEILVVDSESVDSTVEISNRLGARVLSVKRSDFNHGGTRDYAMRNSMGEYVLFMTHDALPCDNRLVEKLVAALSKSPRMAAVYGRQLPKDDATYMERLVRRFNYPDISHEYSKADIQQRGIKAFFMSDVCAMYKKDAYLRIGGFETDIKTNEDMFFAAAAIRNGYSIGYAADACVYHSHNFSLREQYKRNYIQGYEIERHRELLKDVSQNSEGMRMVKQISKEMLGKGRIISWVRFGFDCCARYLGSFMGKRSFKKNSDKA